MTAHVCVFEGEDAAPEAMGPTIELLERMDLDLEFEFPPVEEHTDDLAAGRVPESIKQSIDEADTVLFGAARADGNTYISILTYLRTVYGGGLPANIRPAIYFEGAKSPLANPGGIDYTVVRENLEGAFFTAAGVEGDLSELRAAEGLNEKVRASLEGIGDGGYALKVASEKNTRRLAWIVCEYAVAQADETPLRLTCATKSNVLARTDGLFASIIEETAADYDAIEYEHLYVDNAAHHLVSHPQRFDLVVSTNAAGDILSDVSAATVGGLGLAPSGCFGDDAAYFEPVHGTAPDIVGEGIINPTATILSAMMMLDYLGFDTAATRLERAIEEVYAAGEFLTPDQGGSASTTEMAEAIGRAL